MKSIIQRIINKKIKICIVGIGYVGLPLAIQLKKKNFDVFGLENNKLIIKKIMSGKSHINHIQNDDIKKILKKNFFVTKNYKLVNRADIIIICLPTPMKKNFSPDMSIVKDCFKKLKDYLNYNQTIILESTVYPGATQEMFNNINKKFTVGKDFHLVYSPEREDPGNKKFPINKMTKLVSGATERCSKIGEILYKSIFKNVYLLSSIEACETTKLYENTYRAVNIGLVNEMKTICDKMNINIYEIVNAAKTKPFGFKAFYPGPGVGGHCIPIDPHFLSWKAKQFRTQAKFIELSARINRKMPMYVFKKLNKILKTKGNTEKFVSIIGAAYKKNIDDVRESPFLEFVKILKKKKINFNFHDPYVNEITLNNKKIKSKKINLNFFKKSLATIVITDHDCINYNFIRKHSKSIVDTRGRFKNDNKKIFAA